MNVFSEVNFYTCFYVVSCILILYWFKPNIFFKPNGKPREYGFGIDNEGYKKTLYNLHFIILIIVVLTFKMVTYR